MAQDERNAGFSPLALWLTAAGAGMAGISGVGQVGQLGQLEAAMQEQVRQAEMRGQLRAEIAANRELIINLQKAVQKTMTKDGVMELHRAQQELINKLIDWTEAAATKNELKLSVSKLQTQIERSKE